MLMSQSNDFRAYIVRNCRHLWRYWWFLISPSASGIPQEAAWTYQSSWWELLSFPALLGWHIWWGAESVLVHVIWCWFLLVLPSPGCQEAQYSYNILSQRISFSCHYIFEYSKKLEWHVYLSEFFCCSAGFATDAINILELINLSSL